MAGFTEYTLPTSSPTATYNGRAAVSCCLGPDNNIWYVANGGKSRVCSITPTGTVTEYDCPDTAADLTDLCSGPDGNLWVTGYTSNKIYKVTTGGSFTSYSTGITSSAGLYDICSGPDGNLWFTEFASGVSRVGKITTGGTVTEYSTGISAGSQPIAIDSDGTDLWFTEYNTTNGNKVAKITTAGTVTEYAISTSSFRPFSIVKGPDGRMWVGSFNTDKVLAVKVSDGTRTEYTVTSGTAKPFFVVVVGNSLWFIQYATQKLMVVDTDGTAGFTTAAIPTSGSNVQARIAVAADGSTIWMCEYGNNSADSPVMSKMASYRIFDPNRQRVARQAVTRAATR